MEPEYTHAIRNSDSVIASASPFGDFRFVLDYVENHNGLFSAALTIASVGIASFAAWTSTQQVRRLEESDRLEMAPYLTVSYVVKPRTNGTAVIWIEIKNHGRTPAHKVKIEFSWIGWNRSSAPTEYPFLNDPGGISVLAPGDSRLYYICPLDEKKIMLARQPVAPEVHITYLENLVDPNAKPTTIKQKLDLRDLTNLYKG